jgi:hypothetical protein
MRFELMTSSLPRRRSTPELRGRESTIQSRVELGAGDETRTRDPQLGRLMLYQLSYTRSPAETSNFKSEIFENLSRGAGGRIRTYVELALAGFTARCH